MAKLFIVLNILLLVASCSSSRPKGKTEAEVLYQEAESLIKAGRYILATEKLNRIRSKYPYSYYATFAELLSADVLFKQENYAEAAAAYIVFKDFHPKHKKADYVVWRIGESFFKQLPDTYDRDLSPGFEAIKYFKELQNIHKASEFVEKAKTRVGEIEEMMRSKEKYIADFYFKTGVYDAARFRYENIISDFVAPDLRAHAMIRSLQASEELGEPEYCQKNGNVFTNMIVENFKEDLKEALEDCLKVEPKVKEEI